MRVCPPLYGAIAVLVLGASPVLAAESEQAAQKPYTVEDGKVDKKTFNGWRRYTESCLRCHGPDGAGSSYGPDLVESAKRLGSAALRAIPKASFLRRGCWRAFIWDTGRRKPSI